VNDLMQTIGQRIRALREMHDLTQAELAKVTDLARTSVANIEGGRQNIQVATLTAIARHFGVAASALLGESDLPTLPRVSIATTCAVDCGQCGRLNDELTIEQASDLRRAHIRTHLGTPIPLAPEGADERNGHG
jgi:transcriptional regulator with XRE-family HTH domain